MENTEINEKLTIFQVVDIADYLNLVEIKAMCQAKYFDRIKNFIIINETIWQIQHRMNDQTAFCNFLNSLVENNFKRICLSN
jgi:hypothetical protein